MGKSTYFYQPLCFTVLSTLRRFAFICTVEVFYVLHFFRVRNYVNSRSTVHIEHRHYGEDASKICKRDKRIGTCSREAGKQWRQGKSPVLVSIVTS